MNHHIAQRPLPYLPATTLLPDVAAQALAGRNEWWTPWAICEAVRQVLNGVDLDPASCAGANENVQAARFFTIEDNALAQPWHCRSLFLNPPFGSTGRPKEAAYQGQSLTAMFLNKLWAEWQAGHIREAAIVLSKADPKCKWFQGLWRDSRLTCFCKDRVFFDRPGTYPEKIMFGTCLTLLADSPAREARFIEDFKKFGRIARAVDPDPEVEAPPSLWLAIGGEQAS